MNPWEPVDECPHCGSEDIDVDEQAETLDCNACRSGFGGALIWKSPIPIRVVS